MRQLRYPTQWSKLEAFSLISLHKELHFKLHSDTTVLTLDRFSEFEDENKISFLTMLFLTKFSDRLKFRGAAGTKPLLKAGEMSEEILV